LLSTESVAFTLGWSTQCNCEVDPHVVLNGNRSAGDLYRCDAEGRLANHCRTGEMSGSVALSLKRHRMGLTMKLKVAADCPAPFVVAGNLCGLEDDRRVF